MAADREPGAHASADGFGHQPVLLDAAVEALAIDYDDRSIPVTVSLGVAEYSEDIARHEDVIANADEALYRSKENGRNCVRHSLTTA